MLCLYNALEIFLIILSLLADLKLMSVSYSWKVFSLQVGDTWKWKRDKRHYDHDYSYSFHFLYYVIFDQQLKITYPPLKIKKLQVAHFLPALKIFRAPCRKGREHCDGIWQCVNCSWTGIFKNKFLVHGQYIRLPTTLEGSHHANWNSVIYRKGAVHRTEIERQCSTARIFKGALSGLKQFLAAECPLKMMKKAFYFTSKALFVFKIF